MTKWGLRRQQSSYGFTLIEMMVVVSIIGILSAIAIPAFSRYMAKAKSSEAPIKLKEIYSAIGTYYMQDQTVAGAALSGSGTMATGSRCIVLPTGYLHGTPHPHSAAGNKGAVLTWNANAIVLGVHDRAVRRFSYYANEYSSAAAGDCGANPRADRTLYILTAVGNVDGDSHGTWAEKERHRLHIGVDNDGNVFHGGGIRTYRPGQ